MRRLLVVVFAVIGTLFGAWLIAFSPYLVVAGLFEWDAYKNQRHAGFYTREHMYRKAFAKGDELTLARDPKSTSWAEWTPVSVQFREPEGLASSNPSLRRYLQTDAMRLAENECRSLILELASRCRIVKVSSDGDRISLEFQMKDFSTNNSWIGRVAPWLFGRDKDYLQIGLSDPPQGSATAQNSAAGPYRQLQSICQNPILAGGKCEVLDIALTRTLVGSGGTFAASGTSADVALRVDRNPDLPT